MMGRTEGFTLIELLVTVAIVGILAAIAIPVMGQYRARAYDSAAITDLRNAMVAVEAAVSAGNPAPSSPNALQNYGFRPSRNVIFPRYQVGTVGGNPEVHMHTQHTKSQKAWHTRYPTDGGVIDIR
jgi:prepilin-type N-terminal cleavage/methylation domain-containing protein